MHYDIAADFAVLCSNCHRMIHRSAHQQLDAISSDNSVKQNLNWQAVAQVHVMEQGRSISTASYPLFLSPAEMPLMVS